MAAYPNSYPSFPVVTDYQTVISASFLNQITGEVSAIAQALGLKAGNLDDPSHANVTNTVGANIDALAAEITSLQNSVNATVVNIGGVSSSDHVNATGRTINGYTNTTANTLTLQSTDASLVIGNSNIAVTVNGSVACKTLTVNGVNITSSRILKKDIEDLPDMTETLMLLRPRKFRYKADGPNAPFEYGWVAEEAADVSKELVREGPSINLAGMVALTMRVVQEQQRQIQILKGENKALRRHLGLAED